MIKANVKRASSAASKLSLEKAVHSMQRDRRVRMHVRQTTREGLSLGSQTQYHHHHHYYYYNYYRELAAVKLCHNRILPVLNWLCWLTQLTSMMAVKRLCVYDSVIPVKGDKVTEN